MQPPSPKKKPKAKKKKREKFVLAIRQKNYNPAIKPGEKNVKSPEKYRKQSQKTKV